MNDIMSASEALPPSSTRGIHTQRMHHHFMCTATSSTARGTMINLVMSVWISTKGKVSIQYGKVELRQSCQGAIGCGLFGCWRARHMGLGCSLGRSMCVPLLLTLHQLTNPSSLHFQIMEASRNRPHLSLDSMQGESLL